MRRFQCKKHPAKSISRCRTYSSAWARILQCTHNGQLAPDYREPNRMAAAWHFSRPSIPRRAIGTGVAALFLITHAAAFWLGQARPDWGILSLFTLLLVTISLGAGALAEALHRDRAHAEQLALTDDLTGIWNRRRIRLFLEAWFASPEAAPE